MSTIPVDNVTLYQCNVCKLITKANTTMPFHYQGDPKCTPLGCGPMVCGKLVKIETNK
jgi:hypothetical protein